MRFGKRVYIPGQQLMMQTGPRFTPHRFAVRDCLRVREIVLRDWGTTVMNEYDHGFTAPARDRFARCDGFKDWSDLMAWFRLAPNEEKVGQLIQWAPAEWEQA